MRGILFSTILVVLLTGFAFAQPTEKEPRVIQVNEESIKPVLIPKGKPRLVNFWATWCTPCVEEFPLLVKLDKELGDQIDVITVSLDDPVEKTRGVLEFLNEQKAEMPAYLLYTSDENSVIGSISKEWQGGLPFSVIYATDGSVAYSHQGLLKEAEVRKEIDKLSPKEECKPTEN